MVTGAGLASAFGGIFGSAAAVSTFAYVAAIVINIAISALLGKLLAPDGAKTGRDAKGIQNVIKSNIAPRRIIYGEALAGGPYALIETGGDTNEYLNMIVILAGHPVEEVLGMFIEDEYVRLDGQEGQGTKALDANYSLKSSKFGVGDAVEHVKIIKNLGW